MYTCIASYTNTCMHCTPMAKQGEECRIAGASALLQLVHGRLELGVVRLHRDTLLTGGMCVCGGVMCCM